MNPSKQVIMSTNNESVKENKDYNLDNEDTISLPENG